MNNDLEQLRINRVKMRAENHAFFYVHLKRILKLMAQETQLMTRTVVPVPENLTWIKPVMSFSKNINAGMETHYDKHVRVLQRIVIWVKIDRDYIK